MNFKKNFEILLLESKTQNLKRTPLKIIVKTSTDGKILFFMPYSLKNSFFGAACNIFSIRSVRDIIHSVRDIFPFSFDGGSSFRKKGKCQTFLFIRQSIDVWWLPIRMRAFAFLFSIGGGSKVEVRFSYVALIRTWHNSNRAVIQ